MTSRRKTIVVGCCACVALLAVVQVTTYVLWAETTMPLAGFRTLGFARPDAQYSFIVLQDGLWASLSERQRTVVKEHLSRHAENLYLTHADLPEGSIRTQGGLFEYVNGVSLNWQLEDAGLFWMKSGCGYAVSSMGAGGREDVYIWLLWGWARSYNRYTGAA